MSYKDIQTDPEDDLLFENSDLLIAENDSLHIQNIIRAAPGFYKHTPATGADIQKLQNGFWTPEFKREITVQLESDGYQVKDVQFSQEKGLQLDAVRL
ncbi:MAG: hypothetical protein MI784_12115 [Cytophagales bacterium]|nr:hypothetical protein [Cytophagales bacterium]